MLAFLHTASVHVSTFAALTRELAPEVEVLHAVREDLLARALSDGRVTEATRTATQAEVNRLLSEGARVVVCTCSTLGDAAEATPREHPHRVLRVDRPMAEHAAASGRPILVVAATQTALDTALALLGTSGNAARVRPLLCDRAWLHFEAGDHARYATEVAAEVASHADTDDIVMLAQASMAPVAALLEPRGLDVLTSPRLGVQAALAQVRLGASNYVG